MGTYTEELQTLKGVEKELGKVINKIDYVIFFKAIYHTCSFSKLPVCLYKVD
jgi:hypothetical protein